MIDEAFCSCLAIFKWISLWDSMQNVNKLKNGIVLTMSEAVEHWWKQSGRVQRIKISIMGCVEYLIIIQSYRVVIIQANKMSQYQQNLDDYEVFNILNFNQPQQSQLLSIHSEISPYSPENSHSIQNQLESKKQRPTDDRNNTQYATSQNHAIQRAQSKANHIDFQTDVKNKNDAIHQGSKDDTVELNINFKTIVYNYFKELLLANQLTPEQVKRLLQFGNRSPSFKSFITFCESDTKETSINSFCLKFIESSLIIRRILESRCKMVTKINMIKFVEVLRLNIRSKGKIIKWKQAIKK